MAITPNLTVTGNEAQFNERVKFLKDVTIKGTLTVPDVFGDPNTTFHNKVTFLDIVTFNQDLSFPLLEIRDRLNVGVGGTLITADTRLNPGKVGIGTTQPSELLDVNGKARIIDLDLTNLNVSGLSTFIGITTQKSTLFSTQLSNSGVSSFFNTVNVKTAGGSVIQDASGTLDIRSNILTLTNNDDSQNYAVFTNGAGVELLHTNVKKFQTTGIGVSVLGDLIVPDVGIRTSRVGLGTLIPADPTTIKELDDAANGPLRLDVSGSALAVKNIYDREGSTGLNNYYLRRDQFGIRWASVPPGAGLLGILLQNEGADVPVGLAQTFSTINFVQSNSLGLGTDGLVATAQDPANPTGLATVFTNDYWGYQYDSASNGTNSSIYRMTKVGINVNNPQYQLDVEGTLHAGDDVQFDKQLTVDGEALFKDNVTIRANGKFFTIETLTGTDKFTVATNTGDTDIQGTLDVGDAANFNNTSDASSATSGGSVTIDGGAAVAKKLFVGSDFDVSSSGVSNFNNTSDASSATSGGSVTIDGGAAVAKKLFVGTDFDVKGNTQLGDAASDSLIVDATSTFKANVTAEKNVDVDENLDVDGHTELDDLNVSGFSTFQDNISAEKDLDVDGHTELDNLNVTGVSTFGPGITTQTTRLFANNLEVVGLSTFIGITTQQSTLFTNQSSAVGVATFKNTIDVDADIKDQNDDTGTSVAASLSGNITGATYNATTGVMVLTIANHGFENGDSIQIPDGTIKFSCTYKGSTIDQSYPRSKDPNSGKWLVISNKTANTFEVNVGDGGLSAGVEHSFVSATGGVIHSSGQYVKDDYRLASVGTGVSWRPSGVQTKRTIWVSKSGSDSNSGLLEGDAKATIGAAAAIAVETDTIKIRPGVYEENNPIGLRTDVSVTGEDLRLCIIKPKNKDKDVFHVRRGCLIENLNFGGSNVGVGYDGSACVAFPPPAGSTSAVSGYTDPGPANEGPSGRWRSPYVRNCTNFMTSSIGMKIDGDHADGAFTGINSVGADLKSMVCDSFTQYNENGIGVSLTNNGYAQLVSIFTINTDIAIFASSGAQCDLTNSNSSFGNFGLVAVGLGSTQFTGIISNTDPSGEIIGSTNTENQDTVVAVGVTDVDNNVRRPFDGQALFFRIDTRQYPDIPPLVYNSSYPDIDAVTKRITKPLERLSSVKLRDNVDLSGFSPIEPPSVLILDSADDTADPKGPQGIIAEATATVSAAGELTEINVVAQGRNYLSGQNLVVDIEGDRTLADVIMEPIFFTVESSTEPVQITGITTITFNEFIPYELFPDDPFSLQRISRILTSSHSFEYVGTGTDINIATPLQGAIPIKANEVVAKDGAQIPFTSTDQKGNFDIGQGLQINQTTSSITGRDFSRSIQAEVTPLILALR